MTIDSATEIWYNANGELITMKMSKAKMRANNRWNNKAYDRIEFKVKKGEKESIIHHAEMMGESMNQFICRAVQAQMELDKRHVSEIEPAGAAVSMEDSPSESVESVKSTDAAPEDSVTE